jgi:hypothetical protein
LYLPITYDWLFLPSKPYIPEKILENIWQSLIGLLWVTTAIVVVITNRNDAKLAG